MEDFVISYAIAYARKATILIACMMITEPFFRWVHTKLDTEKSSSPPAVTAKVLVTDDRQQTKTTEYYRPNRVSTYTRDNFLPVLNESCAIEVFQTMVEETASNILKDSNDMVNPVNAVFTKLDPKNAKALSRKNVRDELTSSPAEEVRPEVVETSKPRKTTVPQPVVTDVTSCEFFENVLTIKKALVFSLAESRDNFPRMHAEKNQPQTVQTPEHQKETNKIFHLKTEKREALSPSIVTGNILYELSEENSAIRGAEARPLEDIPATPLLAEETQADVVESSEQQSTLEIMDISPDEFGFSMPILDLENFERECLSFDYTDELINQLASISQQSLNTPTSLIGEIRQSKALMASKRLDLERKKCYDSLNDMENITKEYCSTLDEAIELVNEITRIRMFNCLPFAVL